MTGITSIRSFLFLPADRTERLEKAISTAAGGIILDLEDGVAANAKPAARLALESAIEAIRAAGKLAVVRVNAGNEMTADIAALSSGLPDLVMLPKVASENQIKELRQQLESVAVIALIETPMGVLNAREITASLRSTDAVAFGGEDFATLMEITPRSDDLSFAGHSIALAARAFGIAAFGVVGSIADIKDQAAFLKSCDRAKRAGFSGALTVHPAQVAIAESVFAPSEEEVTWAREIIVANEANPVGAFRGKDGRMVDKPVLDRARLIIQRMSSEKSHER